MTKVDPAHPAIDSHYHIRRAVSEDEEAVRSVVLRAFMLDPDWNCILSELKENLNLSIAKVFQTKADKRDKTDPYCLVATHGARVIAASALSVNPDSENHLTTGPCISMEYRNRGLGTALLAQSLIALREEKLTKAYGLARHNSPTSQFIYTKFGSSNEPYEYEPHLAVS